MSLEKRRTERVSFGVTKVQKAAFLMNAVEAGLSSNDYARAVLCEAGACAGGVAARAPNFELIDALSRIGSDLQRLRFIAEETGTVPGGVDAVIGRLDRKLDHLIVASGLADELALYQGRLDEIADGLERKQAMTQRARCMIQTFDQVLRKVLTA